MKKRFSRFLSVMIALLMVVPLAPDISMIAHDIIAFAEDEIDTTVYVEQDSINRDETLDTFTMPAYVPVFSFPDEMRGVYITPTVDYSVENDDGTPRDYDEIMESVEQMLDDIEEKKLNSIIINTDYDGVSFYSTDVNQTVNIAFAEYAINAAKERGLYVYLNFSLEFMLSSLKDMELQSRIDYLALYVHNFAVRYPVDGIILDGYYSSRDNTSRNDYISNGSGIGFDNWLFDNGAYIFSLASDAVRKTNNTIPVGIALNDVWANYTTNENGSSTNVDFEALTNGYADTVGYIKNGYADFVIVRADGSRASSSIPFNEIVGWWDKHAANADIPLFVNHVNEKICSDYEGWGSPDELVKQVIEAAEYKSYRGSSFNSLKSLDKNMMESTTALIKHYENQIDIEGLNSELEMTLPTKTTFKTEEPSVIFAGSFDPNFPVYYQGKEIELNEAGRFYFTEDLDVGVNTFKFQNKAKTITYKITRTVNVLKSVSPVGDTMRVEENSTISLSAVAYKGSTVTAKVNGKKVTLKEVDGQLDELDPNSNYTKFVGKYTAPEGKRGQDIDLGTVEFYGSYPTKSGDNINESRTGARIIVNALAEILNDYTGSLMVVNNDNTMVYNYKTTDTVPTPDMARLPAGTVDYIVKTVTYAGTDYYLTNSGKRIRTNAVNVQANRPLGSNPLSVEAVGKDGTDTIIKFATKNKIPFNISYSSQSYSDGDNGSYYISSFDATSITVTFDYVTSISSGDLKFPDSAVFTKGTWSTSTSGEMTKTKLTLTLRQQGIYSGVSATYDSSDNLVLRFNGCRSDLSGATIVIDPGHGYTGKSAFDPGAVGHVKEQEVNLALSKLVAEYLENEGANVYRLKTESETYETEYRASYARQYHPDVFISIHCNSAGASAHGAEAFYFTPFSQPLAKYISAALGNYLSENVNSGDQNRGAKYNYFFVTQQQEFASVLIETAFVTNYNEAMALANKTHQKGFAKAIVSGIRKYFAQCGYSCYGDGDGTVLDNDNGSSPYDDNQYEETEPMTVDDVVSQDVNNMFDSNVYSDEQYFNEYGVY